jgi:serine phosphatase RsbU (regulator of sigma subunit)
VYGIDSDEVMIGRSSDSDIKLIGRSVSRQHAKLVKERQGYSIVDLGSSHGTFVNEDRVERQVLQEGDQIRFGQVDLIFTTDSEPSMPTVSSTQKDIQESLAQLSSVFASPEYEQFSDLEKINCILEIQYQWGQRFSPDETFEHILRSVLDISGAERGCVFVREGQDFRYVVGVSSDGQSLSQPQFRASQTLVKQVADGGEPIFMTHGIEGELAQQESVLEMKLKAVACLPLKGMSTASDQLEILGILYVDSTKPMHTLSGLEERILVKLAGEAGNGFEKLEMIRTIEEGKRFEQEMSVAHETQQSLLPKTCPEFGDFSICAFSEPTRHVGGDFYDFLQPDADQLIGVLADVSGKGVPAALLSSMFQGALDIQCRTGASLAVVLEESNRLMYERSPSNGFVTLFLFLIDVSGKGEFVGAGHNPVYLFRAASGEIEELVSQGMILGAFPSATYTSSPLQIDPGDVLVIYSDGVTEAAGQDDEMFEEERLLELIRDNASKGAAVLKGKILEELERFTEGVAQNDDITFLVFEHKRG